jgi:hypothetical protein
MHKLLIAVLSILLGITSLNVSARSNERNGVSTGTMIMGGKLFFAAIEREMYNECQEQSADMWDMEPEFRTSNYKCVQVFKDYSDSKGLKLYRKTEALAKTSYSKLKRALINDSAAAGGSSEPPEGCDAHHIVPEHEGRSWAKEYVESSRRILAECQIDINSAENGVFLPNGRTMNRGCEGNHHPSLHTKDYYRNVSEQLNIANQNGDCNDVKDALNKIKSALERNAL